MDENKLFQQFMSNPENQEFKSLFTSNVQQNPNQNAFQAQQINPNQQAAYVSQQQAFNQHFQQRQFQQSFHQHQQLPNAQEMIQSIGESGLIQDSVKPKHLVLDEISESIKVDGVDIPSNQYSTWEQILASENLLKGVRNKGFATPSRIQRIALPLILGGGRNVIAQAKNGSGKTASFALAMLSKVDPSVLSLQSFCLCPTRELAIQNKNVIDELGKFTGIKTFVGIPQCARFERADNYQLYVGTPGKTMDLLKRRILPTENVTLLVMDEADEMINPENNMGPQAIQIRMQFRRPIQILLFSATFSENVLKFATQVAPQAHMIEVKRDQLTLDCIDQRFMICAHDEDKFNKLCELYSIMIVGQSVIFVNSRDTAFKLSQRMKASGHAVSLLCGTIGGQGAPGMTMTPEIRDRIMKEFVEGATKVLICTDVLARGIDVPQVTLVVNYELPMLFSGGRVDDSSARICMETYLHRIGRTGRFGTKGMAINMITSAQIPLIESIKQFFK